MLSTHQGFLVLYTSLGLAYIALIAPPYRMVVVRCYLLLVVALLVLNVLMHYLGAVCTILDLSKSY